VALCTLDFALNDTTNTVHKYKHNLVLTFSVTTPIKCQCLHCYVLLNVANISSSIHWSASDLCASHCSLPAEYSAASRRYTSQHAASQHVSIVVSPANFVPVVCREVFRMVIFLQPHRIQYTVKVHTSHKFHESVLILVHILWHRALCW